MKTVFLLMSLSTLFATNAAFALSWQECVQYDLAKLDVLEARILTNDESLFPREKLKDLLDHDNPAKNVRLVSLSFRTDEREIEQLRSQGSNPGHYLTRYQQRQSLSTCAELDNSELTFNTIFLPLAISYEGRCTSWDFDNGLLPYQTNCPKLVTVKSSKKQKSLALDNLLKVINRYRAEIQSVR